MSKYCQKHLLHAPPILKEECQCCKLEAQLAAVKNCQRYTHLDASTGNLELCVSYTELKAAIGESE